MVQARAQSTDRYRLLLHYVIPVILFSVSFNIIRSANREFLF
jgi:hypothetical protein